MVEKRLNKIHLQLIAIIAMTIDHLAWLLFPGYPKETFPLIMHIIGRLAFPIMAYFIAEGYQYTRNRKKYLFRIFIFALISHVPYMMQSTAFKEYGALSLIPFATGEGVARFLNQTSVLWAYFIGLVMLIVNDSEKINKFVKVLLIVILAILAFPSDWSCIASLVILSIATNRNKPIRQILWSMFYVVLYGVIYAITSDLVYGLIQLGVIFALIPLFFYNGKKSENQSLNKFMKWFFYIYYPLHLLIIGLIGLFL